MSYLPIAKTVPHEEKSDGTPYSGGVYKAYAAGTSTNISMATDKDGGTLVTSMALNSNGRTEVSGSVVIPHVDQDFKLSFYPTQAAADNNTGAVWTIDNILITDQGSVFTATETGTGDDYEISLILPTSALITGQQVQFIASEANNGACTLNVNALGAVAIKLSDGSDPYNNAISANMIVSVQYDGTNYQLLNPHDLSNIQSSDIASATTTDIGAATGEFVDVTGSVNITGFGTVTAGVKRTVRYTGAPLLTYNATSLITPMGDDYQVVAGDILEQMSLGSGNWIITNIMDRHGTWTPTIQDASFSDAEGQTYSQQTGRYTKIGPIVYFTAALVITSTGTLTGANQAVIAGLPFTSVNDTGLSVGGCVVSHARFIAITAGTNPTGNILPNVTYINLQIWSQTTGTNPFTITQTSSNAELFVSGHYYV